ncbi:C40 family peptidase [Bacillus sp. T33-2]|uniref:C40 family peptidase n=1 Tax=Bacillus sp. T33-2 TaxID=2054168 RepID=UPI0015E11431|nr:C40 family peptidase [Bacillus sp. T33-2]
MLAKKIITTGFDFIGTPYVFNARPYQTENFDCSSFVQYIFYVHGINLPRNSRQQFQAGKLVPFKKMKKGDLLFFTTSKRNDKEGIDKVGHVALYIGNNKILHTYRQGKKVTVSDLEPYWNTKFIGAKRVL